MARITLHIGRKSTKDPLDAGYVDALNAQVKVIENNIKQVMKGTINLSAEAMEHGVEPMYNKSQELVPFDTGALSASGFVDSRVTSRGAQLDMGYGKYNNPHYAIFVHERTDVEHPEPTQAKFLEAAVNMHLNELMPRITDYMKKQFETMAKKVTK